jgi:hypothetical protein
MSLKIASKNLLQVYVLAGVPIFLGVYQAKASTITGGGPGSPAPYTAPYSIYVQKDGKYIDNQYTIKGKVVLHPLKSLQVGRSETYRELLNAFSGFKVVNRNRNPNGEFNVKRYEACPIGTELCVMSNAEFDAISTQVTKRFNTKGLGSIGALLLVDFISPSSNSSGQNPNFVQIVQTSYSPNCNGDSDVYKVDTFCPTSSTPSTPLYYAGFNSSSFYDRPEDPNFYGKEDEEGNYKDGYFNAELFAAKVVSNGDNTIVTLYDGISWGWRSEISRIPLRSDKSSSALPPSPDPPRTARRRPCPAGMPIHSCIIFGYDYGGNGYAQVPLTEIAPSQSDPTNTTPVPTPAILPSLIATGIYHGKKWRKRKKQQADRTAA